MLACFCLQGHLPTLKQDEVVLMRVEMEVAINYFLALTGHSLVRQGGGKGEREKNHKKKKLSTTHSLFTASWII
jgi:hypothetical protein